MATFRGSGSVANGAAFPTEAELQTAIDEAQAAATAAAASQALAEINVTESETAQAAAEAAQASAEAAIPLAHAEVVLAQQQVALAVAQVALATQAVTDAQAEVVLCETQVTLATAQAVLAEAARLDAETAETGAQAAETAALAAQVAAEAALDSFDDRYLGAKASDPTLDNDGDALLTGALYWNTTVPELRIYSGTVWGGVLLESTADTLYQPLDEELTDIALLAPTKGRLIAGNGTAWVDLGVGANDRVLTADSSKPEGMEWVAPAAAMAVYVSPGTTWSNSAVYTYSHGLGGMPDMFTAYIECVTAEGGYSVGDRVAVPKDYSYVGLDYGGSEYANSTQVGVTMGDNATTIWSRTTHSNFAVTQANWRLYVVAYKLG